MKLLVVFGRPIVLGLMVASLFACGGGGDNGSTPTADKKLFIGTWKRTDGTSTIDRTLCFNFSDYGGSYGGLHRPLVITSTTVTTVVEVYSDTSCTTYLGYLKTDYSAEWKSVFMAGATTTAKVVFTSVGVTLSRDGAAGFSLTSMPKSGEQSKVLMGVAGDKLYVISGTAPLDADGYPTALPATPLYSRQ